MLYNLKCYSFSAEVTGQISCTHLHGYLIMWTLETISRLLFELFVGNFVSGDRRLLL